MSLLALGLAACGHARDEVQADPGTWSREMPDLLRETSATRGFLACRNRAPGAAPGRPLCAPMSIEPGDKLYVTTAVKQERLDPDAGFQLNYYRDVWSFCFIVVRDETSREYLADFRRGVIGPNLASLETADTTEPAAVLVSLAPDYVDMTAKNGCDWLWNFTETPQKG
ncbi:MAG: hypothetical protein Kilf2KO_44830 [Rhodospirillales bacterium]